MKRIVKIITIALLAVFTMNTASSCGELGDILDNTDDTEYGDIETGWTEKGNKLIYKISLDYILGKYTQVMTFEFSGETCIKATIEYIWSSDLLAQSFYESLDEDERAKAKLSGKTITMDATDDFKGMSKSEIKEAIDAIDEWL